MANMNTNVTTSAGMSPELKIFYDKQLIENAKPNLIYYQFAQKRPIPKNGGQTINFRRFTSLPAATTPLTEGVTPDGRTVTVTEKTAAVRQYGDYITTSDFLELTAPDKIVTENNKLLGDQAGLTLDELTARTLWSSTNVQMTGTGSGGSTGYEPLTFADVRKAVATLKSFNVKKIDGAYVAIVHPKVAHDLMSDPAWEAVNTYNPEHIYEGEIGKLYGVRFVETTVGTYGDTSEVYGPYQNRFFTYVLGDNAYGVTEVEGGGLRMIAKSKGSAGTADPLDQRSTQGWKASHVACLLADEAMVKIVSSSSIQEEL